MSINLTKLPNLKKINFRISVTNTLFDQILIRIFYTETIYDFFLYNFNTFYLCYDMINLIMKRHILKQFSNIITMKNIQCFICKLIGYKLNFVRYKRLAKRSQEVWKANQEEIQKKYDVCAINDLNCIPFRHYNYLYSYISNWYLFRPFEYIGQIHGFSESRTRRRNTSQTETKISNISFWEEIMYVKLSKQIESVVYGHSMGNQNNCDRENPHKTTYTHIYTAEKS